MTKEHIKIAENFSVDEAAKFREETYRLISKGSVAFELDFSNCTFIDSTGLGVLVSLFKKCKENNSSMILKHINNDIMKIFHMTRLDNVFDIQ